jgi:hypothetical protein
MVLQLTVLHQPLAAAQGGVQAPDSEQGVRCSCTLNKLLQTGPATSRSQQQQQQQHQGVRSPGMCWQQEPAAYLGRTEGAPGSVAEASALRVSQLPALLAGLGVESSSGFEKIELVALQLLVAQLQLALAWPRALRLALQL